MADGFLQLIDGVFELTDTLGLTGGLETALVLTLAGGNSEDAGRPADVNVQWWGNRLELDTNRHLRSRFDTVTTGAAINSSYPRRVQPALDADLSQLVSAGELTDYTTSISIPAVNTVELQITTDTITFTEVFNG